MDGADLLRLLLGLGFLSYAALLDLRTRRVPNGVWLVLGSCGTLLFLADLVLHRLGWLDLVVAAAIVAAAYGLWYVHVIPGGADAKALMALAVLHPRPIGLEWGPTVLPLWASPLPGVVTIWANAAFLMAVFPFAFLVFNLLRGDVAWPSMLLGTKMRLESAERRFVWVVDWIDEKGAETRILFPSRRAEEEQRANIARLREAGRSRVWVTPKFPFMLNLLLGLAAAYSLGDVLFKAVELLVTRLL